MPFARRFILPLAVLLLVFGPAGYGRGRAAGSWPWPVVGPVIRGFEPPLTPYGAGHRGIDIAVPFATPIGAPAPGVVRFAGSVAGDLFISVDHGGGLVSTYSWLSAVLVRRGDAVSQGMVLGLTGFGHPGQATPHLHFGVRLNGAYIDPMSLLSAGSVVDLIRLAPEPPSSGASRSTVAAGSGRLECPVQPTRGWFACSARFSDGSRAPPSRRS